MAAATGFAAGRGLGQYKVVHFVPRLRDLLRGVTGEPVEQQIQDLLNQQATEGWHFVAYQSAHVSIKTGCLKKLLNLIPVMNLGGPEGEGTHDYDIVIFKR